VNVTRLISRIDTAFISLSFKNEGKFNLDCDRRRFVSVCRFLKLQSLVQYLLHGAIVNISIVSDYRWDDRGSIPGCGKGYFPLASVSRPALRPIQWVPGVHSRG
jgi:hypothetical protein